MADSFESDASGSSDTDGVDCTQYLEEGGARYALPPDMQKRERLHALDNAKFILAVWVCFRHLFGPCHNATGQWVVSTAMEFMMPCWTFISGYVSSRDFSRERTLDGIIKVFAIYFCAQGFWLLMSRYGSALWEGTWWGKLMDAHGDVYSTSRWKLEDWLVPYWQLWYLRDLMLWRLILPFWWRLKWPLATAWCLCPFFVAFKVYAGEFDVGAWYLDMNQIVAWFPLFCLGAVAKERQWELWQSRWRRPVGMAILLALIWLPWFTPLSAVGDVFRYTGSMDAVNEWTGDSLGGRMLKFLIRFIAPLFHAACIWGFLHAVPHRKWKVLTSCGERALALYIFHPLSGLLFSWLGVYGPMREDWGAAGCHAWSEYVLYPLIIASSFFWCSRAVWRVVRPVCDPPVHWFLKA